MSWKLRNATLAVLVCCLSTYLLLPRSTAQENAKLKAGSVRSITTKSSAMQDSTAKKTSTDSTKTSDTKAVDSKVKEAKSSTKKVADGGREAGTSILRLPRYFSGIVDQQQREQIHTIQLEFRSKIAELEEELNRIRQDEMQALEKVLTESQRKLLDKKRAQSKSKSSVDAETGSEAM